MNEPEFVGSIVEAGCVHYGWRRMFIKGFDGNWWDEARLKYDRKGISTGGLPDDWDSLIDPEPLEDVVPR